MGQDAEVVEEEITEEVEATGDELEADDSEDDGQEESGDGDPESETQSDSNDVQSWLPKRLSKYKAKVEKANSRADEVEAELKLLREQNALKDLALEKAKAAQAEQSLKEPDPDSFDGGVDDPEYKKAERAFILSEARKELRKEIEEATRQTTTTITEQERQKQIEQAQIEHVKKASKLKIKGYEESEDRVIQIFGLDNFNYLISTVDDSPLLINYLGKQVNEAKALEIVETAKTNPAKAGIIIGGIVAQLKSNPGKTKTLPPPDTELEGRVSAKAMKRGPKGAKFE